MKLPFEQILGKELLLFDGAMGTLLQKQGLQGGALAELWNLEKPQAIRAVHRAYAKSGARVHKSNTFGCNTVSSRWKRSYARASQTQNTARGKTAMLRLISAPRESCQDPSVL